MTRRRPTKQQVRSRAIEKARAEYRSAEVAAQLVEERAASARAAANRLLWAWIGMLEPLAARALKGK